MCYEDVLLRGVLLRGTLKAREELFSSITLLYTMKESSNLLRKTVQLSDLIKKQISIYILYVHILNSITVVRQFEGTKVI